MGRILAIVTIISVGVLALAYTWGVFAWTLFIGIFVTTLIFVFRPLIAGTEREDDEADSDRSKRLFREKAQVFRMLKDLEFEREVGTVDDDEFQILWRRYSEKAAGLNREIDAVDRATSKEPSKAGVGVDEEQA